MRILTVIERLDTIDGVSVQTFDVCRRLAERGHELHVAYMHEGAFTEAYRAIATLHPVRSFEVMAEHPLASSRAAAVAARIGRSARPDVVYDQLAWSLPFSLVAAKAGRARLVSHVHGFGASDTLLRLARMSLPKVDRFLAVSEWMAAKVRAFGVADERVRVVHNGIDAGAYPLVDGKRAATARSALGLGPGTLVVGYLGRIDANKGPDVLMAAASLLQERGMEVEVIVQGATVDESFTASLRASAGPLRVLWREPQADVQTVLGAADVIAVPTTQHESFGRVVVEALASGRPAVASQLGGIPEILTGEFAPWQVPPCDPVALADALVAARDAAAADAGLAQRCRKHAVSNFSVEAMVDAVERELGAA